jgi:hypothetical protein
LIASGQHPKHTGNQLAPLAWIDDSGATSSERHPKGYAPTAPGECVGVVTINIYGSGLYSGMRRYVATFKDVHSRFTLAAG